MTQLEQEDIAEIAEAGSHVSHCPESDLKLASGICPVSRLLEAGVNVALGTDGAASNNDLDMFGEMRSAVLLGKLAADSAAAVTARDVIRMATVNGARALGLGEETGSLVPGKWADMIAVDLDRVNTRPVFDPVSQIVYAAGRDQVTDVWIAGSRLLRRHFRAARRDTDQGEKNCMLEFHDRQVAAFNRLILAAARPGGQRPLLSRGA